MTTVPHKSQPRRWWKEGVVYQIYPASFCDLNGDGWGDIKGITSKVDYIKNLGADIVWLSPIYKSPQKDMGYDISDYRDIDHRYGTLEDVDELIGELGKRGMKLMMDLVVNHTSDKHAWFVESRSSKTNPKRDWYIWQPPRYTEDGKPAPPNNWAQILGEANSAWTWDPATEEYYLSLFTPDQPDLNWENPEVRRAVHDILRFWLDRGIHGFRMDVINLISKVPGFPDAEVTKPENEFQCGSKYFANGPRFHEYLHEMNTEVLSKYDVITVGETPFVSDVEEVMKIVHPDREELNMVFIFELVDLDNKPGHSRLSMHDWNPCEIRKTMARWQRFMLDRGGWNSLFCENHDNPRAVSRYTSDADHVRELCSKLLALMMTTLSGTLYVYQGQELGMRNFPASWGPEEYKDIETINYWEKMQKRYGDRPEMLEHAKEVIQKKARDHSRTPMQWTDHAPNAGFCPDGVKPWMRVNDDYVECNAEEQVSRSEDKMSPFQFWKAGLAARTRHKDEFIYGGFELLGASSDDVPVLAYARFSDDEKWIIVLNFSKDGLRWEIPEHVRVERWVSGNYLEGIKEKEKSGELSLRAWEGLWGKCVV